MSVIGLLITGYSYVLSPVEWPILSIMGYCFPFFMFFTGLFLAVWVFINWRYLLISVLGLIVAYQPFSLYCPLNNSSSLAEESQDSLSIPLTILSFNTCGWGNVHGKTINKDSAKVSVIEFIASQNPDIVCLQESPINGKEKKLIGEYLPEMKYYTTIEQPKEKGVKISFLSKYPIKKEERIDIPSKSNGAGAVWLDVKGKTILVINCHLETQALSLGEKERFSRLVHDVAKGDVEKDSMESGSKYFLGKLSASAIKRAPQAEMVSDLIKKNSGTTTIVCGDFNDIPLTYTHYVISKELTDCYQEKGRGFGFSYCHNAMRVRIDHILCSQDIKPLKCWVENSIELSDHYPIICNSVLSGK